MKTPVISLIATVILLSTVGWAAKNSSDNANRTEARRSPSNSQPADEGERVFTTHCSRCHTPPMSLPPRITGTIIMHMRERARLSRRDEQLLLGYLAP